MKVLIVEDDEHIAKTLKLLIATQNYAVDIATDGEQGVAMAEVYDYDLVVLDLILPCLDGVSFCRQLRAQGLQMPIMVLTGRAETSQKAEVLNAGADDYVVKPFDAEELLARIQALLRRGKQIDQPLLKWGDLVLDPQTRKVIYKAQLLSLTPKEYASLELLLRHPQQIFSAQVILDRVWSSVDIPGEETVRFHIKALRGKLKSAGAANDFIQTVYRVGYRLNSIYADGQTAVTNLQQPTWQEISALQASNAELRTALEKLRCSDQELQQHNQILQTTCQVMEAEYQRHQNLFEFAPDGFVVTDMDGTIQAINQTAATLLQVQPSTTVGVALVDFVVQAERSAFLDQLSQSSKNSQWAVHFQPRGSPPVLLLVAVSTIEAEQPPQRCWLLRQSHHERLRSLPSPAVQDDAQEQPTELLPSHNLWQALFQQTLDAIAIVDDDGRYIDANPAACELFGMAKDDMLQARIADFTTPDFDFHQAWQQFLQAGRMTGEFILHRPDKTIKIADFVAVANFLPHRHLSILRDITARKQLEANLEVSESQLGEVLNTLKAVIGRMRVSPQRHYEYSYLSANCEQVYGYPTPEMLDNPDLWSERVVPEDMAKVITPAVNHILNGRTTTIKYRFRDPDDRLRWISETLIPCWDANTQNWAVTMIALDITDSEQMQDALQTSEEQRHLILEQTGIGWWDWDLVANRQTWNEHMFRLLGYRPNEVVPSLAVWRDRIHPDDLARLETDIQQIEAASSLPPKPTPGQHRDGEVEYRVIYPTGDQHWLLVKTRDIYDDAGRLVRMMGTAMDITEIKRSEQVFRQQAALINIASDAIFVRDLNDQIIFWSAGAERLYGWTAAEAVGQSCQQLFSQTSIEPLAAALATVQAEGFWNGELEQTTKAHQPLTVASRWTLMRDNSGQPEAVLVVNTDITQKRQMERQVYQAQRLESIGTLASGIAHDLNNIFTPILTIVQMLQQGKVSHEAQRQDMLNLLESSTRRGADLVRQILLFALGSNGDRQVIQVGTVLLELITLIQQTFPKTIELKTDIPVDTLWPALAEATQIRQVVMNLCVNARDAMPEGGTLTLTAANISLDQPSAHQHPDAQPGDYLRITVADTGTGIAPAHLERIFDPFFTTKAPGHGTGLGLSIVLGIVRGHGGFVQVTSTVDAGTCFQIYLPAIHALPNDIVVEDFPVLGDQELILIIDDEWPIQQATEALLKTYNYRTLVASNGPEAIQLYQRHHADISLVMIDITMPHLDGVTTIGTLHRLNADVKIVAVSGLLSNQQSALDAGASSFLEKPYSISQLLSTCHRLIREA